MSLAAAQHGDLYCEACADDAGMPVEETGPSDAPYHCGNGNRCADAIDLGACLEGTFVGGERRFVGALCTDRLTAEGMRYTRAMMTRPGHKTPFQRALHAVWSEAFDITIDES